MKDTVLSYPFIDIHVEERDDLTLVLLEFNIKDKSTFPRLNHANGNIGENGTNNGLLPFETNLSEVMESLSHHSGINWRQVAPLAALGQSGFTVSFTTFNGSHCVFRFYGQRSKLTVDIQGYVVDDANVFLLNNLEKLIEGLGEKLGATSSRLIATLPRGGSVNNLFFSSDQRLVVYDFDSVVYKTESAYQQICIQHSKRFGNTLILDDFVNLAEGDISYTHSIMRRGRELYKDSDVLILGGGDGGILHEVVKEHPRMVTMVEIDQMVMDACRVHLRGACGDALDAVKGPHHEIICGDCFPFMESCQAGDRRFDFIFGDLTDCPLISDSESSKCAEGEFWALVKKVLNAVMPLLNPGGKFLTHLTGNSAVGVISRYEDTLRRLELCFEQTVCHVPSFEESWVFYAIWQAPPAVTN